MLTPLKTTLSCPAYAKQYYAVASQHELIHLLKRQQWQSTDVTVLGYGSNTVFKTAEQNIVVACQIMGRQRIAESDETVVVKLGAGENWHDCVEWTLAQGWYGLECLALIPGLVGAAPIQNIGAYGAELANVFESLSCVDIETALVHECSAQDCQLAYRDSIFKGEWRGKKIITDVTLRLSKHPQHYTLSTLYPALRASFSSSSVAITPEQVFSAVCQTRSSKLPDPEQLPNSGSFFKNPVVDQAQYHALKKRYPALVAYPVGEQYKLAAGWLIEQAGFKGVYQENGIGCYAKQALVIINPQHCSGEEVLAFANRVQMAINKLFSVSLEIEPRVY